jgi:uncharacterized protein (TIRG00374 family)
MMPKRRSLLLRAIPFLLLGLLIFAVYLYFFVDINEMVTVMKQTNLPLYSISVIATVAEMFFFALAWYFFLKPLGATLPFTKAFNYSWISYFVDLLVPAESITGELTRIYLATCDGVDAGKAVASVVTQRILGMLIVIGALLVGVLQLLVLRISFPSFVQNLVFIVMVTTAIFLGLIIIMCFKENWTRRLTKKVIDFAERVTRGRWNLAEIRNQADKAIRVFYESLRFFRANPKELILPVVFSVFSWACSLLAYYLVFAAIGYTLDWGILILVYSLVVALKSIPIGVPAEAGLTEIAMTAIFGAFNVPLYVSAAATVLIRIATVWFRFVIGFIAIQWVGIRILMESEKLFGRINK